MTPERFWELIAALGGRADEERVARLAATLDPTEAEEVGDLVAEHVDALLARCEVPVSGDAAEWLGAAVVAAGRETYERALAQGADLDPQDWAWSEAEALLVLGVPEADEPSDDPRAVTLQWHVVEPPTGVRTSWTADTKVLVDLVGLDPSMGQVPADDPHFTAVLADHLDPATDAVRRHLVVSEAVDEPLWLLFPEAAEVEDLVLVVPAGPLLSEPDRRPVYDELLGAIDAALLEITEAAG